MKYSHISGESNTVDPETIINWTSGLKTIIADFEPEDIANAHERALFFKAIQNRTIAIKSEQCFGVKHAEDRLTVLLCDFADGKVANQW